MATATRRLLPALLKTLAPAGARGLSTEKAVGAAAVVGSHTAKWMQVDVYTYPSPHRITHNL
jgi:NADH dehydrogenase (ubiquinone) Fe-S protein 6